MNAENHIEKQDSMLETIAVAGQRRDGGVPEPLNESQELNRIYAASESYERPEHGIRELASPLSE